MFSPKILAIGLLLASCTIGCTIAPSKCTSDNCVVNVTSTNGQIVLQGSNAPTFPPYPSAPLAAEKLCTSLGGDWYKTDPNNSFAYWKNGRWHGVYVCENLPYIGSDGGNYYYSPVDITYGQLNIIQDPEAQSANYQQCTSLTGVWVTGYGYCRPGPGN